MKIFYIKINKIHLIKNKFLMINYANKIYI